MFKSFSFLLLSVALCFLVTVSKSENSDGPSNPNQQNPLMPTLDEETMQVLQEVRPDIKPRILLPGWIPWIPIRLPTPAAAVTTTMATTTMMMG